MTGILSVITAFLVVQGAEVTASVDRSRLRVGEELTLTIRAHTRAADPVEIMLPSLNGFAIVGSRDMTEVAISGASGSIRTNVRERRACQRGIAGRERCRARVVPGGVVVLIGLELGEIGSRCRAHIALIPRLLSARAGPLGIQPGGKRHAE